MAEASSPELFHADGRLCLEAFTEGAAQGLQAAVEAARETRWDSIRSPHMFIGLLRHPDTALRRWADKANLNLEELRSLFERLFHEPSGNPAPTLVLHREFLSDNSIHVLRLAHQRTGDRGGNATSSIDILFSILTNPNSVVAACLKQAGVSASRLAEVAMSAEEDA